MSTVKNYLSLIRFSHTIFAMPFAMIGFYLGVFGWSRDIIVPGWHTRLRWTLPRPVIDEAVYPDNGREFLIRFLLVIGCMVFARSAAMAFNRWLDVEFDAKNPRTAIREIPRGIISKSSALRFVIFNCIAFIVCTWFINPLCFALSFVALAVVLGYSYTKRFTPLCHLVLGVGLSLAPIGAYLAVTGRFALLPLLFSFSVIFWVSGFDIIYALQDEEFDRSNQLYSMPSWLGKTRALRVSEFLHLLSTLCVILAAIRVFILLPLLQVLEDLMRIDHEKPDIPVDLRRRKTYAIARIHRFPHIGYKLRQVGIVRRDILAYDPEDRRSISYNW